MSAAPSHDPPEPDEPAHPGHGFRPGEEILGRFCLDEVIGEGAFGTVWRARDLRLDRDVAIKFLKAKFRGARAEERFGLETQVFARMEHPNIAVVFDAGLTPAGQPFFAMELLRGCDLRTHCAERALSVKGRLELFVAVCRGVHHAHQSGVIHRDLKPANILVVAQDGRAVPKVIDFGIARVTESGDFIAAAAQPLRPEFAGTRQYMSPEQAAGAVPITVLSDVYALGVILYELLAGTTPLAAAVPGGEVSEVTELLLAAIRTAVPAPPSARLTLAPGAPSLSASERADLDAIVLRALEKKPADRYESAAALAADVERHLRDEPVEARAGGARYRLACWTRRHRAAAVAGAVVSVAIVATAAVSTGAYFVKRAALARETVARQAADEARNREAEARGVAEEQRGQAVAARNAAEQARQAAVRARGQAEDLINYMLYDLREQLEPLGRSRLLESVSLKAGEYFDAQPAATDDDALERNRAVMHYNRGRILLAQARLAEADTAFGKAVALMEARHRAMPADAARRLDLARALDGLGLARLASGAVPEARAAFEQQLTLLGENAGNEIEGALLRATTRERLGDAAQLAGEDETALAHYRAGEALARSLHQAHVGHRSAAETLAIACEKIGTSLERQGKFADAAALFAEECTLLRALAEQAPGDLALRRRFVIGLGKSGAALLALKRPAEALPVLEAAQRHAADLARLDPVNIELQRELAASHQRLGAALRGVGRWEPALEHAARDLALVESLAAREPAMPHAAQDAAIARAQRALTLLARARASDVVEARAEFTRSRELFLQLQAANQLDAAGQRWLAAVTAGLADPDTPLKKPRAATERRP